MGVVVADSSVIVGFLDARDAHHDAARAALGEAIGNELVVSAITYSEVMVGAFRKGQRVARRVKGFFGEVPQRVEPVDTSIAEAAARLRARHSSLRLSDALIIATGEVLGADRILTADDRWLGIAKQIHVIQGC